jgi:hypothetical protein
VRQIIKLNELPFGGELPFGNFGLLGRSPPHCHTTHRVVLAVPEISDIILAELEVSHYLLPTSKSKHVQTVLDTDLLSQAHSLLANYFRSAPQTAEQYRTEKPYNSSALPFPFKMAFITTLKNPHPQPSSTMLVDMLPPPCRHLCGL